MATSLFSTGFGPDTPTPAELDSLPTRVAILQGTVAGFSQAATSAAQARVNTVEGVANQITDAALVPVNDALANIGQMQSAIMTDGQQAALAAIQRPLAVGQALGYVSQGTPLLTPRNGGRRGNRRSAGAQPSISTPIAQPQPVGTIQRAAVPTIVPESFAAPTPITKPPPGGATLPTCGVVAFTTTILGAPVVELLAAGDPRVAAGIAAGGTWVSYPDISTARSKYPQPPWSVNDYSAGAVPCPPPGGGGVTPTFPGGLIPGGGVKPTIPIQPPMPAPKPILVIPPPPPSPPPCPCPNITILIPLPEQPPPNIAITVPPCPQCGAQGQPIIFPLPAPPAPIVVPAPPVNISVPPCPQCGAALPPITIQNNTGPVSVTIPPAGGGTVATTSAPLPPPVLPPPSICETCTIPWLNLHYPEFVLASRAAQKTDYDILVDAVNLKLCCGEPLQPGCSMPFLQRMMPEFVSAAKAQGLTDDQVLQQAVNIGLCADVPFASGLGETAVGYTAPGSALAEESEFDPPTRGEAPGLTGQTPIHSEGNDFCWRVFVIPGPETAFNTSGVEKFACLTGVQRTIYGLAQSLEASLKSACDCGPGSFFELLGLGLNNLYNQQTWYGKVFYYLGNSLLWVLREGGCNTLQLENWFNALSGCQEGGAGAVVLAGLIGGIYKRWIGELPDQFWAALNQTFGLMCPSGLPNPAEANDLLASNFISKDTWDCLQRANGERPDYQQYMVQARQERPNNEDLWQRSQYLIARLDQIAADPKAGKPGEVESITKELKIVNDLFKNNGFTNEQWWSEWLKTKQWVPATTDAIQWMIKDVNDPQIVQTFLLGAEFSQKYGGDVKRAFDQNAVSTDDAANIWKAHWRNVAPHQLYEMHKRLRPGWTALLTDAEVLSFVQAICPRKSPQVTEEIIASRPISNGYPVPTYCDEVADAATARSYLESLVVTGYHASEALGQDDFPAFWRPRLLALSYNVLTRVDARRAYELGLFNDEKLTAIYEDRGYKHSDAVALVAFAHAQLVQRFVRSATAKQWIQYPYPINMLADNLEDDGMRPDLFDEVYPILERKRATYIAIQQLQQVKKAVVGGRMNQQNAAAAVKQILAG